VKDWLDLAGKVALVTGASRGIGKGISAALQEVGVSVVLADIDAEGAETAAKEVGGTALALDVTQPADVDAAVARIVDEHGKLDILVNNAGLYREHGGPIVDLKPEVWRQLMAVNLDGVFYCARAVSRAMIESKVAGRIINVASTQAFTPGVGVSYDSSKAAVVQLTRTLALEMARHGINVNAVAPGATWVQPGDPPPPAAMAGVPATGEPLADLVSNRIGRIPLQRWGTPEDVGKAVVFLASPMADYITGACVPVDGGWLVL
jgi:2-deoxy-D-gluconate 3-dehydrogenase